MSVPKSTLLDLAARISTGVETIQAHLDVTHQPSPLFDASYPAVDLNGVDDARNAVLDLVIELQELLMTPKEILLAQAPTNLISRHFLARNHEVIARTFPPFMQPRPSGGIGSPHSDKAATVGVSYTTLSHALDLPLPLTRRLFRHAIAQRIFYEPSPDRVAHTHASRVLFEDSAVRDYVLTICEEVWPCATRGVDAVMKGGYEGGGGGMGYELAKGCTLQQTLEAHAVKQARYDNAMTALSDDRSFSGDHVVNGYDWATLGRATVVDIGGGVGTVSVALARAFPLLNFVVQDKAQVIASAKTHYDEAIASRIKYQAHDMTDVQPVQGAQAYFFRRVMMEKSRAECVAILSALIPALKPGAVVLIQDPTLPDPGSCPLWRERKFRDSDLLALVLVGSCPREEEAWREIFMESGKGFEFRRCWGGVGGSNTGFVEAVWRGEG